MAEIFSIRASKSSNKIEFYLLNGTKQSKAQSNKWVPIKKTWDIWVVDPSNNLTSFVNLLDFYLVPSHSTSILSFCFVWPKPTFFFFVSTTLTKQNMVLHNV